MKGFFKWLGTLIYIALFTLIVLVLLTIIVPDNVAKAIEVIKGLLC